MSTYKWITKNTVAPLDIVVVGGVPHNLHAEDAIPRPRVLHALQAVHRVPGELDVNVDEHEEAEDRLKR